MCQPRTERLGVSKLDTFFSTCGWLFREQFHHDYGIDGQVEIVHNEKATGKLIAIQVKSGLSYFGESTDGAFIFRIDDRHKEYWENHCLPVIVVLYHPEKDRLYWEAVTNSTLTSAGDNWKIPIPKNKYLSEGSLDELSRLMQPPPYFQKLNRLLLDKEWIDLVANGETVFIEFGDWIHKSLPRFTIKISCETDTEIIEQTWPTVYGADMEEVISHTIPWAKFEVDMDAHYEYQKSKWYDECFLTHDQEDDEDYFTVLFDDWYTPPNGFEPVGDNGEIEFYRLVLSLNDVGNAFCVLQDYLTQKDDFEDRTFTMPG